MPPLGEVWDLLLWAVLPALVGAGVLTAALQLLGCAKQGPAAAALGLITGTVLGQWLRAASPMISVDSPWPALSVLGYALTLTGGESTWNRLPWAVLAALAVERLARCLDTRTEDGWFLRGAASIGIAWWVIPEAARDEYLWLAPAFAALVFTHWILLERLAAQPPDGSVLLCLALAFIAAGVVLLHARIARLMEASIVCAAALGGIGLVALWLRADASGAIPAAAVLLPGFLLMGTLETSVEELPWYVFALPALAPLLLAASWPLRRWEGFSGKLARLALMLILVLIPLAAACVVAHLKAPLDMDALEGH
jgi:hypothetical protein